MERNSRSVTFSLAGNQSGNQRDYQQVLQRGCLEGEPYFCRYIKSSQAKFYLYCLKSTVTICVRGALQYVWHTTSSVLVQVRKNSHQTKTLPKETLERPQVQNTPPRTHRHAKDISTEHIQTITVCTVHFNVHIPDTHRI